MNLLILFGGKSGEHDVSCLSAQSVLNNISKEKYNIIKVGITREGHWLKTDATPEEIASGKWTELENTPAIISPDPAHHGLISKGEIIYIDAVFPVMHGDFCEDGCIQGLFELAGIPYVGPGVLASSAAMDKSATKLFAASAGVPQADWLLLNAPFEPSMIKAVEERFEYPVFIKPCNAGSSLGVSKATNSAELESAIKEASKVDNKILCEEFVNGKEVECSVLGNLEPKASTVGEIVSSNEFYDYNAKYIDNASILNIPASIPAETIEAIQKYAVKIYKALGCRGLSRVDFFVHKETGKIYFNEINTLPGFTAISMYPKLWEHDGIPYSSLIDKLIELALNN